jgi:hypothetical protein
MSNLSAISRTASWLHGTAWMPPARCLYHLDEAYLDPRPQLHLSHGHQRDAVARAVGAR